MSHTWRKVNAAADFFAEIGATSIAGYVLKKTYFIAYNL